MYLSAYLSKYLSIYLSISVYFSFFSLSHSISKEGSLTRCYVYYVLPYSGERRVGPSGTEVGTGQPDEDAVEPGSKRCTDCTARGSRV